MPRGANIFATFCSALTSGTSPLGLSAAGGNFRHRAPPFLTQPVPRPCASPPGTSIRSRRGWEPRRLAARGPARRRLPAGNQVPGRGVPARAVRGAGLQRRDPRPEDLQRRRHPLEAAVRGGAPRPARRRRRRAVALHRGGHRRRRRPVRVASIYLPNGNPIGTDKYRLQAAPGWSGSTPTRASCSHRGAAGAGRRLQRDPRARGRDDPETWLNDALFLPRTRASSAR